MNENFSSKDVTAIQDAFCERNLVKQYTTHLLSSSESVVTLSNAGTTLSDLGARFLNQAYGFCSGVRLRVLRFLTRLTTLAKI